MTPDALARYEQAFADWHGQPHGFAFWKGRVALYAILKALGVGKGDEVIIPGYTCVMVVNPVMYLGATPVYVDIDPETYNTPPDAIDAAVTPRTRAIVAQHTYGIPARMTDIMALADRRGITVVEDCCLALGARYEGRLCGTFGAAAYWSFQWNKPYTTGVGGMATTRDPRLAARLTELCRAERVAPSAREVLMLRAQLLAYRAIVYPRTTALIQRLFRWLTHRGLVIGSSSNAEFTPDMEPDFFKGLSPMQARRGLARLRAIDHALQHRRRMAALYDEMLRDAGFAPVRRQAECDPVLVRYPLRVADKRRAVAEAPRHAVELGTWFESPLHPAETDLARYAYRPGMCPVSEQACREVVNLPLHPRAGEATARRTVAFLRNLTGGR